MTIETLFNIGDQVTHKEREGIIAQIRIDVLTVDEQPATQITYKVSFDGKGETRHEEELNGSSN